MDSAPRDASQCDFKIVTVLLLAVVGLQLGDSGTLPCQKPLTSKANEPFAMQHLTAANSRCGSAAVSVTSTDRPVFHRQRPYRCTAANWHLGPEADTTANPTYRMLLPSG